MTRQANLFWMLIVWGVSSGMIVSCAKAPPAHPVSPELLLPAEVIVPCEIARLGSQATLSDLEQAYMQRGMQLVACDAARAMAVEIILRERRLRFEVARQD